MELNWIIRQFRPNPRAAAASANIPRVTGSRWQRLIPLLTLVVVLGLWQAIVSIGRVAPYILPAPGDVALKTVRVVADGTLLSNTAITLVEVLGGLSLGMVVATTLGYLLARSVTVEQALAPYLVATQAIPIVAIAPILIIWFGYGLMSKILISALIVFFPILINTIAGVRGVPTELRDLMRSLRASRWQTFTKLEVPAALPVLLAGLKVGATLSVIGAVVGEMAGANAGLGVMIGIANGQYDVPRMFVGVFALVALALALYGLVSLVERRALRWKKQ
jgi:NitT/TauT family transport system permease protein